MTAAFIQVSQDLCCTKLSDLIEVTMTIPTFLLSWVKVNYLQLEKLIMSRLLRLFTTKLEEQRLQSLAPPH